MKQWVSLERFVFPVFPVHRFSRVPVTALALFLPIGAFSPSGRHKFHIIPPPLPPTTFRSWRNRLGITTDCRKPNYVAFQWNSMRNFRTKFF
jgi:hypothetical protein